MEDTYNLLGHALKKALGVIARQQGRGAGGGGKEAGAPIVDGTRSLKAALDLDWDNPQERQQALMEVLGALESIESWLDEGSGGEAALISGIETARRVRAQDVQESTDGTPVLRQGGGARSGSVGGGSRDAPRPQKPSTPFRWLQASRAQGPGQWAGKSRGHHGGQRC